MLLSPIEKVPKCHSIHSHASRQSRRCIRIYRDRTIWDEKLKSDIDTVSFRTRSPTFGQHGMVATSQIYATQVGVDVLKKGGSAVDAAIAANAMLSLTEPYMCGPGGDLFALVWDPQSCSLAGLNASGRSPRGLSFASLLSAIGDAATIPARGPLALSVPGAVDGWCALHERYGKLPLSDVFAPAIDHARAGVPIGLRTAQTWAHAAGNILDDPVLAGLTEAFSETFLIDGVAPRAGQIFRNPELAETFETIGRGGREAFYEGFPADQIITCQAAAGGFLSLEDLRSSHFDWVTPLTTSYRGYDVYELPPNGQGICVLQMLNLLEDYPLRELGPYSADYWHAFIEAKKLSFEDRARYYADPAFSDIPATALIDKSYADARRVLIDPKSAGADYAYGNVSIAGGDTTYLTVADSAGMMVSLIQSIFTAFGAGLVPSAVGFGLQSRSAGFSLEIGHPNVYAPAKRPFHTIIPAFVLQDGRPWLSTGVMGADMQPQGQVQVLINMIDFDLDPQAAGDAPRMRHYGGRQPNGVRLDGLGVVRYEAAIRPALVAE
ncbi:MAG: gamma-glutamyltransferase family protein, partial [Proteobacteria bacterium]